VRKEIGLLLAFGAVLWERDEKKRKYSDRAVREKV